MPDLTVPADTVAVVFLASEDDGTLRASYAEIRDRVPVTRSQVVDVLLRLAVAIDEQRIELDTEARRTG